MLRSMGWAGGRHPATYGCGRKGRARERGLRVGRWGLMDASCECWCWCPPSALCGTVHAVTPPARRICCAPICHVDARTYVRTRTEAPNALTEISCCHV